MAKQTPDLMNGLTAEQATQAAALLAKETERLAKLDAKKAATVARKAAQQLVRDARKAAGENLRTPAEKAEDFRRLAKKRVAVAVRSIRLVANLATRSQYEYTDTQVATVMTHLSNALAACEARFEGGVDKATEIEL